MTAIGWLSRILWIDVKILQQNSLGECWFVMDSGTSIAVAASTNFKVKRAIHPCNGTFCINICNFIYVNTNLFKVKFVWDLLLFWCNIFRFGLVVYLLIFLCTENWCQIFGHGAGRRLLMWFKLGLTGEVSF